MKSKVLKVFIKHEKCFAQKDLNKPNENKALCLKS